MGWAIREFSERAKKRLAVVVPMALVIIFGMLLVMFGETRYAVSVFVVVPFALVGGILGPRDARAVVRKHPGRRRLHRASRGFGPQWGGAGKRSEAALRARRDGMGTPPSRDLFTRCVQSSRRARWRHSASCRWPSRLAPGRSAAPPRDGRHLGHLHVNRAHDVPPARPDFEVALRAKREEFKPITSVMPPSQRQPGKYVPPDDADLGAKR